MESHKRIVCLFIPPAKVQNFPDTTNEDTKFLFYFFSVIPHIYPSPCSTLSHAVVRLLFDCCPIVVRILNEQQTYNRPTSITQNLEEPLSYTRPDTAVFYRDYFSLFLGFFQMAFDILDPIGETDNLQEHRPADNGGSNAAHEGCHGLREGHIHV